MSISFNETTKTFKLDTPHSTYAFSVSPSGYLLHDYYGGRVPESDFSELTVKYPIASFNASVPEPEEKGMSLDTAPLEYPTSGLGDTRMPALTVITADGGTVTDLRYISHAIYAGKKELPGLPATFGGENDAETLEVLLRDELTGLEVCLFYTLFDGSDAIARSVKVTNGSEKRMSLRRIYSADVDLPDSNFTMLSLEGCWAKEASAVRRHIGNGFTGFSSRRGASGHGNIPFYALIRDGASEENGEVYGFSLVYSGNFTAACETDHVGTTRAVIGLCSDAFDWPLAPGESFSSPEAVTVYSRDGLGGMSRTFHKLYRKHLCRGEYALKRRPVLINNWEATYFDFTGEKLLAIAKEAASLGIDLFVMDDGWFGHRNNADSSLGDWFPNEEKLGCSLPELVGKIRETGLSFGIWFEPEMISEDSDLFRRHPEWRLCASGRIPSVGRDQYVLDLTNPAVRDYLFDAISSVLSSAEISYVKWDFNRNLSEVSPADEHRYYLGLYELLERLLGAFPHLLLESCSGGGGRFDPGMLYYSPQIWASDNTDPIERLTVEYGMSLVYPLSAISAHVSASPNHITGRATPFTTRGNVAMTGSFGYELDLSQLTEEEKTLVRKQIKEYDEDYDLIASGDLYRLTDPNTETVGAWEIVSEDKREVRVTYVPMRKTLNSRQHIRLSGLDPDLNYCEKASGRVYSGAYLMNAGLPVIPWWNHLHDADSRVFRFSAK